MKKVSMTTTARTLAYRYWKRKQLTIIPRTRVGYGVIDSRRGAKRRVCYFHLISNKHEWNNCFIKTIHWIYESKMIFKAFLERLFSSII